MAEDPNSYDNVADQHPDVVRQQRDRLEGFLGHPLPARLSGRQVPSVYPALAFEQARARQGGAT